MNKWKNAATLMVAIRSNVDLQAKKAAQNTGDYKLLVIRRHEKNSFMPTKIVFPGGTLNGADFCTTWNSSFESILGRQLHDILSDLNFPSLKFPMIGSNNHWPVHPEIALRICAIRETFEESGILVALSKSQFNYCRKNAKVDFSSVLPDDSVLEWRNKVLKNPFEFIRLCNHFEIVPNIWALMEWNNWLTPRSQHVRESKRFDTMFYLCCFEGKTFPTILPHLSEITEAYWASPAELLTSDKKSATSEPSMPPPQFYEITEFSRLSNMDELKSAAHDRSRRDRRKIRFLPVRIPFKDGYVLALPGDHLYPKDPENFVANEAANLDVTIEEAKILDSKPKNRFVYQGGKLSERSFIQDLKNQL